MSKIQEKARERLAVPNKEIASENQIYVEQLQELARIFSSSGDKHIRQFVINIAKEVIERSNDYNRIEGYVEEILS